MIFIIIFLSCIWGIILAQEVSPLNVLKDYLGLGSQRKTFSKIPIVDYLLFCLCKLINCPKCLSYHIFWISYLIIYGSWIGLIFGGVVYFLTGILQKII